jgi:hypothetical protein
MEFKDVISVIAVLLSPIIAILVSQYNEKKRDIRNSKMNLFMTLMMYRQGFPINEEIVKSLNLIDIVFHDCSLAVSLWHEYLDMLSQGEKRNYQLENRKYLDLLLEVAKNLGYKNLRQTDIDRGYFPVALGNQKSLNEALQAEQLKYLQSSNQLLAQQSPIRTLSQT